MHSENERKKNEVACVVSEMYGKESIEGYTS